MPPTSRSFATALLVLSWWASQPVRIASAPVTSHGQEHLVILERDAGAPEPAREPVRQPARQPAVRSEKATAQADRLWLWWAAAPLIVLFAYATAPALWYETQIEKQWVNTLCSLRDKWAPRAVAVAFLAVVLAVQVDGARKRHAVEDFIGLSLEDIDQLAPNLHHDFARSFPTVHLFSNGSISFTSFGRDLRAVASGQHAGGRGWPTLCALDSDGDGLSNGAELGDPCCTWVPGLVAPYRVWNLSEPSDHRDPMPPGHKASAATSPKLAQALAPQSCEAPDMQRRAEQFYEQYYLVHPGDEKSEDGLRLYKYPCGAAVLLLLGHWALRRGLLRDLFGMGPRSSSADEAKDIGLPRRLFIHGAAYIWTDGVAGLVHLTFDFCPHTYPFIGYVARGFQYHHVHPTAWAVLPMSHMLSHSLPLLGLLSLALAAVPQRRHFRAFWALTYGWCMVTVLTHRWVHVHPETNFAWFRLLQWSGVLMSHEHHMQHHDSLMVQFSNLSGITDGVLNFFTRWVPAWQYQHWLTALMLYFAVAIAGGAEWWGESSHEHDDQQADKKQGKRSHEVAAGVLGGTHC